MYASESPKELLQNTSARALLLVIQIQQNWSGIQKQYFGASLPSNSKQSSLFNQID